MSYKCPLSQPAHRFNRIVLRRRLLQPSAARQLLKPGVGPAGLQHRQQREYKYRLSCRKQREDSERRVRQLQQRHSGVRRSY